MGHYSVSSNAIVLSHGLCLGYSVLWSLLSVLRKYILASWLPAICPPGIIFHMEFKKEKGKIPGFRPLGEN